MKTLLKYSTALLMIGIGLAAGVTSFVLNVSHGLEASIAAAVTCGLADLARCSVPVIAATRGWNTQLKYAIFVLGAFSLWNISNYVADQYGRTIWDAMQADSSKAARSAEIEDLKVKIAAFKEQGKSATLRQLADDERKNKFCGPECKKYQKLADEAERREALEAAMAKLKKANDDVAPVEIQGFGVGLVAAGMTPLAAKTTMLALKGFGTLIVVDMLVYFLIPGFSWLREDKAKARLASMGISAELTVKAKPEGSKKKVSKEEAYGVVCARLLETSEGSILTSCRQLAAIVGVPKTTMTTWIQEWAENGKLLVQPKSKHRALVSLPKAA